MRTAHAPHHHRARQADIPKSERPRRPGMTLPRLIGGVVGAFLGLPFGYVVGVAAMWALQGRTPSGVLPPPTLWEALIRPGELALYTPLSIPLGFLFGGFVGERVGRLFARSRSPS